MNYCNYHNAEWCKRFDGVKTTLYETRIEGNTLYVLHRRSFIDRLFHRPSRALDVSPGGYDIHTLANVL